MFAWTVRSWRIVSSGGYGFVFGISRLMLKCTWSRGPLSAGMSRFLPQFQQFTVCGRALINCKKPVTEAKKINHAKTGRRVHEATASPQLGRRYQTPR